MAKRNINQLVEKVIFTILTTIALATSVLLTIDYIEANNGSKVILECDINKSFSCSTVATSWQSTVVHIFGKAIPNALIGAVGFSVFLTIAIILLCNIKLPRWMMNIANLGLLCATIFSLWLFYQSFEVIGSLCIWCTVVMFCTIAIFFTFTRINILQNNFSFFGDKFNSLLKKMVRVRIDTLVGLIILIGLFFLIYFKYIN